MSNSLSKMIKKLIPSYRMGEKIFAQNEELLREIAVLRKEQEALREQQERLMTEVLAIGWQHLGRFLTYTAAMETSKYIIDNMGKVPRFENKYDLLSYVLEGIPETDGLFLEFGVYSGDTINHISFRRKDVKVYGFDSFEGLPETWRSGYEQGTFNKEDGWPEVNPNVELVQGWFDASLPNFLESHEGVCRFIHVDCDLYSSTMTVLELLRKRMIPGTVIVFDEYFNYPGWQQGEYKALEDFCKKSGIIFEYIGYSMIEQAAVRIVANRG